MHTVGVKELKDRLSYYLRKVKRGEKIIVTERNKAIASLVPVGSGEEVSELLALVQEGVAAWNGGKPRGALRPHRLGGRPVAEIVRADRR
ncbi:MAG: type II toxin-antitoxin system prevent-host-death family antitoxin [Candidatus Bipolaricaulota bacterium]|nr:type II toxin-antitoxin system prevent-host-death family antitoxin [Candidatus Bipolaricaulota bacterium]